MIYLLTVIGLSPGGSTHLHTNNTQNNTNNIQIYEHCVRNMQGHLMLNLVVLIVTIGL